MTIEEKKIELDKIAQEIRDFKGLEIAKNCLNAVPGEGDPDAKIMFIGEAPGADEDAQGRPFVGRSGQLLRQTITESNIKIDRVFITNIVKYRPPENRDPEPLEIEICRDWLDRQIQIIEPATIVTLGRFSMAKFLPDAKISQVHGQGHEIVFQDQKYYLVTMYHPAFAIRGTSNMMEFKNDFGKLRQMAINALKLRRC
ncbi:MAG: uracil-DNA glycosylase [Candidatus Amesbacteria bacterium]|nr:uracil-DNA glycosylase [Candidatus Amesbacteria bacterium]